MTAEKQQIELSLILPCYNEAEHFEKSITIIIATMDSLSIAYEILLIDDCSTDRTAELIRSCVSQFTTKNIRAIFNEKNTGRGAVVSQGLQLACGTYAGFIDIDLEVPANAITDAFQYLCHEHADIVIGQRIFQYGFRNWQRCLMTECYRFLVRTLLKIPAIDTESGCKFFRRNAILGVLPTVEALHWFWDTEIIVRAYDNGLSIHSIPVTFTRNYDKTSTVRMVRDSLSSCFALIRFWRKRT